VNRDRFIRRVFWFSAAFNLLAALLFAFPASPPGKFAGFPTSAPLIYRMLLALFILLFAGAYGWLAQQAKISRTLVAFSAIGKICAFTVVIFCWLLGEASSRGLPGAAGDLIFAALFTWWLLGSR
jgi:cobalamin synthase